MLDSSAGSNVKGFYIHFYRLQRIITNAVVIRDISFSDESKWMMISSSTGTSHLFELSSSDAATKLQSKEVKFANNSYGSDFMKNALGKSLHGSSSPKHVHMNLLSSGTPVTLSAVSRIRNGNPGLKGAVSGAAAAATGKVNPSYGATASTFHNRKAIHPFRIKMIAEGLLDKHGKPNEKTPTEWQRNVMLPADGNSMVAGLAAAPESELQKEEEIKEVKEAKKNRKKHKDKDNESDNETKGRKHKSKDTVQESAVKMLKVEEVKVQRY